MRYVDEFRDPAAAAALLKELRRVRLPEPVTFMEVCGSHTMAISRFGLRGSLPEGMRLVSGPGCPVCVTPVRSVDHALALAALPGVTITTFGDLLRVPGSTSSLERARAEGADIRVVYSTLDALALARREPARKVVFLGVGFETTAPTVAAALLEARAESLENFFVLSDHKLMPPPMRALVEAPDVRVRGFLCPGHVSTIIGSEAYRFLAAEFGACCVVAGFEPLDILRALLLLARQVAEDRADVENAYGRAVTPQGNRAAQAVMARAFEPADGAWRGFGVIPASGLAIRAELAAHDASRAFLVEVGAGRDHPACRCPEVLRGVVAPPECPLFARGCTPSEPKGACMVSSEGTCAAYYRYERLHPGATRTASRPAGGGPPSPEAGS
ncbi:MAG: hydrogenase formation protein HypD [Thermoleophilia bacterium]|nr:hydrogenase formation protein HypD [Thermoleophilia bacterium]